MGCRRHADWEARYSDARRNFRQGYADTALKLTDAGYRESASDNLLWNWKFRILKAELLLRMDTPGQSADLLAPEPPANAPIEITVRRRIVLGKALCELNRRIEAEAALKQAEALIPTTERGLSGEVAYVRGVCALSTDLAAALRHFQQASDVAHGADPYVEAYGLLNAGFVLLQHQHYDEAIEKLNQGLVLSDSPFFREKVLGNLGYVYSQLGDWKNAAASSKLAERTAAELRDRGNQEAKEDQEAWLIDLGREHFSQLEYSQAEASFSQALSIAEQLPNNAYDIANCLHNLAQVALKLRDVDKAEVYARQVEMLHVKGSLGLYSLLDEAEIAKARGDFPKSERILKEILQSPATNLVLRWRADSDLAGIYIEQRRFPRAEAVLRDAVRAAENARLDVREDYRISFLDRDPFYDQYVRFVAERGRSVEALRIAELGRSPTLAEALSLRGGHAAALDLESIRHTLKRQRQVVLAYWLAEGRSYLWAITPSRMELFKLPAETEIQAALESYQKQILDHRDLQDTPLGQKLYEMLVRPAEKIVPKGSDVIIVPHRKLYNFNFETLIVPGQKPHYWIEDVTIENIGFLAALANPGTSRSARRKDLLLIGAPVEADPEFPTLKHAAEEMQRVGSHFSPPKKSVVGGAEAMPQTYSSSHPAGFRYIHFVTHGTANVEKPLESAIILSRGPDRAYKLYAREIMATPVHAELVTISACYSAGARAFSGEGIVGLAWAFMHAGAHHVIAALWEVDDASTPQLMDNFYGESLTHGESAAQALREAKLRMLHSSDFHRRPYYWASLQLYTGS